MRLPILQLSIFLILFSFSNVLAQQGEVHYQAFQNRNSTWKPIGDSLAVSFNNTGQTLGSIIKINLVTGEWKTKGPEVLIQHRPYSRFAELSDTLAIGNRPGSGGMRISRGFGTVIKDTNIGFNKMAASESYLLGLTNNNNLPLQYSANGTDWFDATMDQTNYNSFNIAQISGDRVLATGNRIARSFDGGKTFETIALWDMPNSVSGYYADLVWTGDSGLYFMEAQGAYSNDFGANWTYYTAPDSLDVIRSLGGDSIMGLPSAGSRNIRLSTDGGATWNAWMTSPTETPLQEMFTFGDTLFLVDDNEVIWRTKDWGSSFELFLHPSFSSLIGSSSDWKDVQAKYNMVTARGDGGAMIVSTDYGSHFDTIRTPNLSWRAHTILENGNILATANNGIYLSTDLGKTWHKSATLFQGGAPYSEDSTGTIIAAGTWVSTDGGLTFNQLTSGPWHPEITVLPSGRMLNFEGFSGHFWVREYDAQGNFTTIDSTHNNFSQTPQVRWVKMLSDTHGWGFFYETWSNDLLVYWTTDGWQSRRLMQTITQQGSNFVYAATDLDVYSPTELFLAQGYPTKLLYHSADTGKTWLAVDSLPLASYPLAQEFTSATARDTDSWWVTNERFVIRRNPRSWDPWKNFSYGIGQQEFAKLEAYKAYPNPTYDRVHVPRDVIGNIEMYNSMGQVVANLEARDGNVYLNILPDGMYFLVFETPHAKYVSRVYLVK